MRVAVQIIAVLVSLMATSTAWADISVRYITFAEWQGWGSLPRVVYYDRYRVKGRVCEWPRGGIAICLDKGKYGHAFAADTRLVCNYTDNRNYLLRAYHGLGLYEAYECSPERGQEWRRVHDRDWPRNFSHLYEKHFAR